MLFRSAGAAASAARESVATQPALWLESGPSKTVLLHTSALDVAPSRYSLLVRACSGAGLCSMQTSPYPLIFASEPPTGSRVSVHFGTASPLGRRFISSPHSLLTSWDGFEDETVAAGMPLTFEVCVGTTPHGCQVQPFTSTSSRTNWSADDLHLQCGQTYYVAVRASNCAGLQRTVASEGAKLCCEPPTGGAAALVDGSGAVRHFVGDSVASEANVTWSGFSDACSGVREYMVAVEAVNGTEVWRSPTMPPGAMHIRVPASVLTGLADGGEYIALVQATNHAGLSSRATHRFRIDRTLPTSTALRVRWPGSSARSEEHTSELQSP